MLMAIHRTIKKKEIKIFQKHNRIPITNLILMIQMLEYRPKMVMSP